MAKFAYLFRDGDKLPASPQEMQQWMGRWMAWFETLTKQGHYEGVGQPLEPSGKTLRGKDKRLTDGPFAEAKDLVGGFAIISAATINEATDLARGCPCFEYGGSVEVRPVRQM